MPRLFVVVLLFFVLFFSTFSFFLFCLCSAFILVEDLCVPFASFVDFPFFFWRVSSEGGFSLLFSFLHWVPVCQNVFLIPLVGLDIPCTIGTDGGFIRRDRSFHLPRIDLARAGRCVTDTLSKKLMSVGCPQGNRFGTISSSNLQDEAPTPVVGPLFISLLLFHLSRVLLGAWRFGLFRCVYSVFTQQARPHQGASLLLGFILVSQFILVYFIIRSDEQGLFVVVQ